MSIRPIDFATMAPKSQETSQLQMNMQRKNEQAQTQLGQQFQGNVKHNTEQTVKSNKSEYYEYQYKEPKERNSHSDAKDKGRRQEKKKNQEKSAPSTGHFDITI